MERFSNIHTLLAFVTVVREGSVSAAAEVLNLTQPAVSHQIKRLSEETGVTLFHRSARGLQLTSDGAKLVPKAQRVVEAATDFHRHASQSAQRLTGKLRIGTIIDPEFIRLGHLLGQLRQDYPDVETELSHGVSGDTLTRLRRGQLDAGFYLSAPQDLAALGQEGAVQALSLADFSYRVIGPAGWQSQIQQAGWPELAALPWIGTPEASVHYRLLGRVFDDHGCVPNVVALVDQEASMLEMVRSGLGLSLCRESIALAQQQSHGLALCHQVSVPARLSFVTAGAAQGSPIVDALMRVVREVWRV
jgi:DNA-binding transcriptional LysR family regulator